MALYELYHVVADYYDVNPDHDFDADGRIIEGMAVTLDSSGFVQPSNATDVVFGLAGDTLTDRAPASAAELHRPYQAALIINPQGATRFTSNRVSDFYDETRASGKLTIYHGGGKFASDQVAAGISFAPGDSIRSNATGLLTTAGASTVIGIATSDVGDLESGIPGTDIKGSIALGDYVTFTLRI